MPSSQPLPPKEKTLFNRILKCYEQKQYRNGLKFAKQILSNPKFAEHGETLAMKGLTLNCTGRKEEAYELVKRGLKNDLKSHVCWHVYGLLQRSDKKYEEAIKCYRNALRWDQENLHILRDLSMLQVHMRDLEGYRETRYNLLQLKPGQRASWLGYAISNHLLKDYMVAFKVLDEFAKTQQADEAQYDHSELLLYQGEILKEAGCHQEALDHIERNKMKIVDKLSYLEMKGDLLIFLEQCDEAEDIYTGLLHRNPENHSYFKKMETILKPSSVEEKLEIYEAVTKVFPKADSPKLLPLSFTYGPLFQTLLSTYMRSQLHRGVPPLFTTLKFLYKDSEKIQTIAELIVDFIDALQKHNKFHETDVETQPPTTLLWARFFYSQHLDAIKSHEEALAVLNEALEHTPTLIELHVVKAKILKHLGDLPGAVACIDEAQSLDTADRFINCKCACYMIRNDMIAEADETAAKFTRENTSVEDYLREMQCMWYEVECAQAHYKAKRFGEALRKCYDVDKHFFEIVEDQFDFHQYCMRKMTLRSYVEMLKTEDAVRTHRFYYVAAKIAIKVYLHLHDEPYQTKKAAEEERKAAMSSAELKKYRAKQRKERKKAEAEEKKRQEDLAAKRKQQNQRNPRKEEEQEPKKEDTLDPERLASVADPLEQALKFLTHLELHCQNQCDTHLLAFQIALRKGKLLVMLRSLLRAQKTAKPEDEPELHLCKMQFASKVRLANGLSSHVTDVINQHLASIYDQSDAEIFNQDFLEKNCDSLPHIFAASRAMYYLDHDKQGEALNLLLNVNKNLQGLTWQICEAILTALRSKLTFGSVPEKTVNDFMAKCNDLFPRAWAFLSNDEKEARKIGPTPPSGEVADNPTNGVSEHLANSVPFGDSQSEITKGQHGLNNELKIPEIPSSVELGKTIKNGKANVKDGHCINTV